MTTAQKIIKYLAIAFAIFIIVTIVSAILSSVYVLVSTLEIRKSNTTEGVGTIDFENTNVATVDIDVISTNLIIKTGDSLRAETNNKNIVCRQNNQNLQIQEKSRKWFNNNSQGNLIIYVPDNMEFETIKINAGAGQINIENLNAKKFILDLGAGNTEISNLNITKDCDIDGGVGKLNILSGKINNLDLDLGIGETDLIAMLEGKSEIDSGIGKLNIVLLGNKEDYKIKTNKGIGSIKIGEEEIKDDQTWGTGENYIKLDGAIGNIKVDFKDTL